MGVGEGFNFAAYAFAPASLVTPLGALSILDANPPKEGEIKPFIVRDHFNYQFDYITHRL